MVRSILFLLKRSGKRVCQNFLYIKQKGKEKLKICSLLCPALKIKMYLVLKQNPIY